MPARLRTLGRVPVSAGVRVTPQRVQQQLHKAGNLNRKPFSTTIRPAIFQDISGGVQVGRERRSLEMHANALSSDPTSPERYRRLS